MGIVIIPRDKKAMKEFVGKTKAWIEGFVEGQLYEKGEFEKILDDFDFGKYLETDEDLDERYYGIDLTNMLKELKLRLRDK